MTIVDQAPDCLLQASLRNEGKVHLGLVYANDPSGRTPGLMLDAALRFDRAVEELVGAPVDWSKLRSAPFVYAVLAKSLRTPSELTDAYAALQLQYEGLVRRDDLTYLGTRPQALWRPLASDVTEWLAPAASQGAVATAEVALDTDRFCRLLRSALESADGLECRWGHRVDSAARRAHAYRIEGRTLDGQPWTLDAPVVVNCLWEDRLRLDAQLGLAPERAWVHRLKFRLLGRLSRTSTTLPSFTFVLGPFGDVVTWPSGRVYLSWYPVCVKGWSSDVSVPDSWREPCAGRVERGVAEHIAREAVDALATIVPALGSATIDTVDAGVITAWGVTDIDDPASELHQRHHMGPARHDGWVSVNTGKLTTAPVFARQAAALAFEAAA